MKTDGRNPVPSGPVFPFSPACFRICGKIWKRDGKRDGSKRERERKWLRVFPARICGIPFNTGIIPFYSRIFPFAFWPTERSASPVWPSRDNPLPLVNFGYILVCRMLENLVYLNESVLCSQFYDVITVRYLYIFAHIYIKYTN